VRTFVIIFLLAMSIRIFFLLKVPQRYVLPHDRWEGHAIATSLVEHGRFADPYMIPTGPTTHLPPLVPGITALFWALCGMNLTGGYAAVLFGFIVSSALYAAMPWIGGQLGLGREPGVIGGIAGAFIVRWPGNGEYLAGLILGILMVAFARRWSLGKRSIGGSVLLGLACGTAFHLQPVLLTVVIGWLIYELWHMRKRQNWLCTVSVVLGMIIACVPWTLRNYAVFNEFIFIRGNLGLELRMGNHEGAAGAMEVMDARGGHRHPRTNIEEAMLVREMGEAAYMRDAKREAFDWIKKHPHTFLELTTSRALQFWFGPFHAPLMFLITTVLTVLAVTGVFFALPGMTSPQRVALLMPLLFYPMIYYIVAYMPRYRVPLDWMLLLLAGVALWRWIR
jgi:hypothetical protein